MLCPEHTAVKLGLSLVSDSLAWSILLGKEARISHTAVRGGDQSVLPQCLGV